ncbi:MAG: hypothetical protein IKM29_05565 [Clostridia bacterium]|nr:hypothetical protein [Clostridia bacterium]
MKKPIKKLVLTSILCAVSLSVLLLTPLIPSVTVSLVAVAGLFVAVMFMECGIKYAVLGYVTVGLLASLLVSDKTVPCMFIFFFGHYPIFKGWCESMRRLWVEFALKISCFNIALFLCLYVAFLFGQTLTLPDFPFAIPLAVILANAVFLLYDFGFSKLISLYRRYFDRRYRK